MFLEERDGPPAGFPGDNDHWHNHPQLCFAKDPRFVLAEHVTAERCAEMGGELIDSRRLWMVHVWLPVYDGHETADIFNRSHPGLGKRQRRH